MHRMIVYGALRDVHRLVPQPVERVGRVSFLHYKQNCNFSKLLRYFNCMTVRLNVVLVKHFLGG